MPKVTAIIDQESSQIQIVRAIKNNDLKVLKALYQANYHKVKALVLSNNGSIAHAKDIYQDAFIAVWKNIKNDKFTPKNDTAIDGYLYTIAKNKWMDYLRSKRYKKTLVTSYETHFNISDITIDEFSDDNTNDERLHSVMQSFKHLGLPCKTLLTKFYFEKKSMRDIAKELKLDAASTRNKKYRCMQKLRKLALNLK